MFSRLFRGVRRLHVYRSRDPVAEELRGWSWYQPPLRPRAFLELGVSEVAYRYCPTRRDLWLRRRVGVQGEPSEAMRRGAAIHEAFHRSNEAVLRGLALGMAPWDAYEYGWRLCVRRVQRVEGVDTAKLCKEFAFMWSSAAEELGMQVAVTEAVVDGSLLGLSRSLRVDASASWSIVLELKYGSYRRDYTVALAGYALAIESSLEVPVDFGALILVNGDGSSVKVEPVYIGNDLRREFVEVRDEAVDLLLSDVEPRKPQSCPQSCPFKKFCG